MDRAGCLILAAALDRFERIEDRFRPKELQQYAQRFCEAEFVRNLTLVLDVPPSTRFMDLKNFELGNRAFVRE